MTGKDKILSRGSGVHAEINIVPVERNNIKECNLADVVSNSYWTGAATDIHCCSTNNLTASAIHYNLWTDQGTGVITEGFGELLR